MPDQPHHSQVEIERKYDVDAEAQHPLLVGVGAVAVQGEPERNELVATYFDTADLRLESGVVLMNHHDANHVTPTLFFHSA